MQDVDSWFHDQLTRIKADRTPAPETRRKRAPISPARRRIDVLLALIGLAGGIAAFANEATSGPMLPDHPFGLTAPPALFHPTAMLPVNGHNQAPAQDRNTTATTGIGARR